MEFPSLPQRQCKKYEAKYREAPPPLNRTENELRILGLRDTKSAPETLKFRSCAMLKGVDKENLGEDQAENHNYEHEFLNHETSPSFVYMNFCACPLWVKSGLSAV
jgi:hypothetical protein